MRWLFVLIMVLLFEGVGYLAAYSIRWGFAGWLSNQAASYVLWGILGISNVLLLAAVLRLFSVSLKLAMTWLTLLWLLVLVTLVVAGIHLLIRHGWPTLYQQPFYQHYAVMLLIALGFTGLIGLAVYNAYSPVVRHLRISLDKPLASPLRIGVVSDLHLGLLVGKHHLTQLHGILQQQKVQLLLMPGDIMDDDIHYYQANQLQSYLQAIVQQLPLGAYATLGNHDLYGHRAAITQALEQAGIRVLADQRVLIDQQIWLIGRLDDMIKNRKPTATLLPAASDLPLIVLDHRPSSIDEHAQLPIDLQLSGHTHNGQIFPANLIVRYLNTVAYGHQVIGNTHVVVSSGYGFWGVPFRLGSQSEIWVIDVQGTGSAR